MLEQNHSKTHDEKFRGEKSSRAYPRVQASTHCEEKDIIKWRTCARFPIPRIIVSVTTQARSWKWKRSGMEAHMHPLPQQLQLELHYKIR